MEESWQGERETIDALRQYLDGRESCKAVIRFISLLLLPA